MSVEGLGQNEIGRKLDLDQSTVSRMLKGAIQKMNTAR
jgi:DNA-directed RNA polymerase specialized sigma subunit